jgi:hypothetical protein
MRGRCVYYTGSILADGYGIIRGTTAHRYVWMKARGSIPDGMDVMHLCDVLYAPGDIRYRKCINLNHLALATTSENVQRMYFLNRGIHKTTPAQVIEIRQLWETGKYLQRELGAMFGLTQPQISQIVRRVSWRTL